MTAATLTPTNGTRAMAAPDAWLQSSVQQFFGAINWEDQAPTVQPAIKFGATPQEQAGPLSMSLKVGQFFGAVNWDGTEIAAAVHSLEEQLPPGAAEDGFTLDGFSDLF